MANVVVKIVGGETREITADTVGTVKAALNMQNRTAVVNGVAATDATTLADADFVVLSQPIKGGR